MAYTNLGAFLTQVTLTAIGKLENASVDECMRIATNVESWATAGSITEEQVDMLAAALPRSPKLTKSWLQQALAQTGIQDDDAETKAEPQARIEEAAASKPEGDAAASDQPVEGGGK